MIAFVLSRSLSSFILAEFNSGWGATIAGFEVLLTLLFSGEKGELGLECKVSEPELEYKVCRVAAVRV